MRRPVIIAIFLSFIAVFAGAAIYRIYAINRAANQTLARERSRLKLKDRLPVERTPLGAHDQDNVEIIQNTREVRDLVLFNDRYYVATGGGLVEYSPDGTVLRHLTVLDGLPKSDLTCLAVFEGNLYIGTRTAGLVVFNGESFAAYRFTDRDPQAITCFLLHEGRLLVGTFNGGLLDFDGRYFVEIRSGQDRILSVNCLSEIDDHLYVGTFNNGIFLNQAGTWRHYSTADGLASNRIVGIEQFQNVIYAATDFGLSVFENERFRSIATVPALSGSAVYDGRMYLVKDNGAVYTFDGGLKETIPNSAAEKTRLTIANGKPWVVSNKGISLLDDGRLTPFGTTTTDPITDNFISALAVDDTKRLWVGSFRRGIDVISPGGGIARHIESESIREINYLAVTEGHTTAATSAGLFEIDSDGPPNPLVPNEDLPSRSISHFSDGCVATARGLALRGPSGIRVFSTVQGLPNNSVYTTLKVDEKLYAGTLGGLAVIEEGRVTGTFTSTNSGLDTNWVTALRLAGGRLFIGTYGGGAFEVAPSGDVRPFGPDAGKFTVNPNAIYSDEEHLYFGTLTGVHVLDLNSQAWSTVRDILPSQTVMSITGDAESIYFGTAAGVARVAKTYFSRK